MKSGRMPGSARVRPFPRAENAAPRPGLRAVPPLTFWREHGILFPKENGEDGGFPAASCRKNKAREGLARKRMEIK